MELQHLLTIHGKIDWRDGVKTQVATGVYTDSRELTKNGVFVAIRGHQSDGHKFLTEVSQKGAAALVVEDGGAVPQDFRGAVLEVLDSRLALQLLSQNFYGRAGDTMLSVAVTGTNGKTSFTLIFEALMGALGHPTGVIGTIDHHLEGRVWATELTTPNPIVLQERLRDFKNLGAQAFVIEASSHALKQKRLQQGFDLCVFTNLSRDHLDYHPDEEDYFRSKALLFTRDFYKPDTDYFALINGDDEAGLRLGILSDRECFYFGQSPASDFQFTILEQNLSGATFKLTMPKGQEFVISSPLLGAHNVANVVAALASLYLLNLNWENGIKFVPQLPAIPGRLQNVPNPRGVHAFVDFAHTDDALRKVLTLLRDLAKQQTSGRLFCVFGCGGDRDRGKRKFMGQVAADLCRHIVVTSDNPRSENPMDIIKDIIGDLQIGESEITIEPDRKIAIHRAVAMTRPGDILLVAGKGHEKYQIIGSQKHPFDDVAVLHQELLDASIKN